MTGPPRAGAQTLEDIMKRQRGEAVDNDFRRNETGDPNSAAGISSQLGTLGGVSDPELWRALRFGSADITVSSGGKEATVLMQDGGMRWLIIREGPLATYGGYLLIGTLVFSPAVLSTARAVSGSTEKRRAGRLRGSRPLRGSDTGFLPAVSYCSRSRA